MTIPRLELRAALIASRLLVILARSLDVPLSDCHLWSDSRIVLSWVQSDEPVGNELVDNYVAQIHELCSGATWHHVPTADNPADIASRGADALKLESATLWWNGPTWLAEDEGCWPSSLDHVRHSPLTENDAAAQRPTLCAATQTHSPASHHIDRFSSLTGLLRGTVRARRLLLRAHCAASDPPPTPMSPTTASELRRAFIDCVKLTQAATFARELTDLRSSSRESLNHRALRSPTPFIDDDGVLRAGGRLADSLLPHDERHPPILDGSSHLAQLIIR
ncbi:uncharacterized protein LOC131667274 [Phymastichus coffea]|uniref:uncharacterized protein LOC131667274 n=1 Tax=Phymastichus coffea TaxID=108790 RepID=UPI00273BB7CB|nr:uncharacterized protein LOC131667274 [Phymastichus coffea]